MDKLKVAICFSGHLRNVEEGVKYWKEIVQKYDADVYGSFWDMSDDIGKKIDAPQDIYWKEPANTENIEKSNKDRLEFENEYYKYLFIKELNPKKIEFENIKSFRESATNIYLHDVSPPLALNLAEYKHTLKATYFDMWYKVWRANLLSKDKEYDIILRTRIDIFFDENFVIEKNDFINIPSTSMIWCYGWKNCVGPIDVFAYGNSYNMDYYCSLYLFLTRYLSEGHYMQPCENILKVHLAQRNLIINVLLSRFYLFRSPEYSPFHGSESYKYSSKLDISTDNEFTFYKKYEPTFSIISSRDENKIIISTNQKINVQIFIWDNSSLIYSRIESFYYNSLWVAPIKHLNSIDNVRIEIKDICDNLLKEEILTF